MYIFKFVIDYFVIHCTILYRIALRLLLDKMRHYRVIIIVTVTVKNKNKRKEEEEEKEDNSYRCESRRMSATRCVYPKKDIHVGTTKFIG